jgi:uncharacterized protein DUF1275
LLKYLVLSDLLARNETLFYAVLMSDPATYKPIDTPTVGEALLGVAAGSVDVIGFPGLGGLFIARVTGNLVALAARSIAGGDASVAHLLSAPVFVTALAAARLLAAGSIPLRIATLKPPLLLQFLLFLGVLAACIAAVPAPDPNTTLMCLQRCSASPRLLCRTSLCRFRSRSHRPLLS